IQFLLREGRLNRQMLHGFMFVGQALFRQRRALGGPNPDVSCQTLLVTLITAALSVLAAGCAHNAQTAGLIAGGIATAAVTPTHELEQIYYLGVFDPDEQLPRSVYRLRVHGQSSPLNATRFASGWVP